MALAEKRLIKLEKRRILFFRWTKPYLFERMKAAELREEIERMIYSGEFNEREKCLLSLLIPAGLTRRLFPDKNKRRDVHHRLKQLGVENELSIALKRALAARWSATT
jgi:hypothetical protein